MSNLIYCAHCGTHYELYGPAHRCEMAPTHSDYEAADEIARSVFCARDTIASIIARTHREEREVLRRCIDFIDEYPKCGCQSCKDAENIIEEVSRFLPENQEPKPQTTRKES